VKRHAAEHLRDVSAYRPAALTTVPATKRSWGVASSMPSRVVGRADERTADDDRDVAVLAKVFERLDQRFRFEDAGVGRPERGDRAHVRFLRLDEVRIDEPPR
jgi:hypothetical protein